MTRGIIKSYKYKLKLTKSQIETFEKWLGVTCLVYNLAKQTAEYYYEATGKTLSAYDLEKQMVVTKRDYDWMRELPKDTLNEPLTRFERARKEFFAKRANYPKWAKRRFWKSLHFIQQNKTGLRIENGKIKLHKGFRLNYFNNRNLPQDARIKRIAIIKEIDGWYASIMFGTESHPKITASDNQVVGIDMGVARFYTLSTGEWVGNPEISKHYLAKLRRAQRSLSRKKKGSGQWEKQRVLIAKLYRKITRIREDFQHKESTGLVVKYSGFILENLSIHKMLQEGHKNVSRAIGGAGISEFITKMKYKSEWNDRIFEKVNPMYSSQECYVCTYTSPDNRKTQIGFKCVNCGHEDNADVNAAKNILKRAGIPPIFVNLNH